MAKRLEVYDLNYNILCLANDNSEDCARNIQTEQNLNQINKITFELPLQSSKWKYVLNENLVKYDNEFYFIRVPKYSHSTTVGNLTVIANIYLVVYRQKIILPIPKI